MIIEVKPMLLDCLNIKEKMINRSRYFREEMDKSESQQDKRLYHLLSVEVDSFVMELQNIIDKHTKE